MGKGTAFSSGDYFPKIMFKRMFKHRSKHTSKKCRPKLCFPVQTGITSFLAKSLCFVEEGWRKSRREFLGWGRSVRLPGRVGSEVVGAGWIRGFVGGAEVGAKPAPM